MLLIAALVVFGAAAVAAWLFMRRLARQCEAVGGDGYGVDGCDG